MRAKWLPQGVLCKATTWLNYHRSLTCERSPTSPQLTTKKSERCPRYSLASNKPWFRRKSLSSNHRRMQALKCHTTKCHTPALRLIWVKAIKRALRSPSYQTYQWARPKTALLSQVKCHQESKALVDRAHLNQASQRPKLASKRRHLPLTPIQEQETHDKTSSIHRSRTSDHQKLK